MRLHREGRQCEVIVAALESCSRPPPLKQFLYLDFIDGNKFDTVWEMLVQKIRKREPYIIHVRVLYMYCIMQYVQYSYMQYMYMYSRLKQSIMTYMYMCTL